MRPGSPEIEEFLIERGAGQLSHPGGTLYEHLVRVAALLADWGASEDLQAAGLCHAGYGTDGYPHALLGLDERPVLRALAGDRAESLVYLYGSCDRSTVHPALSEPGPVPFRDRFTGRTHVPPERDTRAFTELTAANELDVIRHNAPLATRHGAALRQFFRGAQARLSPAAWQAWNDQADAGPAGQSGPGRAVPVTISHLDHLVLTVADMDRTTRFYQQVHRQLPPGTSARAGCLGHGPHRL